MRINSISYIQSADEERSFLISGNLLYVGKIVQGELKKNAVGHKSPTMFADSGLFSSVGHDPRY